MKAKSLVVAALVATLTASSLSAAISLGTDTPLAPQVAAGEGPAQPALEAFREGRHTAAVELAKPLAAQGNADALFLLGVAAESGQGLTASRADALDYYKKASAAGHKDATYRRALILLNSKEDKERQSGREALESAARTDPANAGRILGEAWLRGLLSEKPDAAQATQWWQTAANAGDTPSLILLARLREGSLGFPEQADPKAALDLYRKAAALGDDSALVPLGSRLLNGDEKIRNEKEGREWLAKAAEKKILTAYLALGDYEENVRKDNAAALEAYRKGAEAGQPDCMVRLAAFHLNGIAVDKSEDKGREWLKKAAEAGSPLAALELAVRLSKDEKPDLSAAYKYLVAAANAGLPLAQNELGLLYLSGNLGLGDATAAAAWFTRAARAGHAAAQNNLAAMYERGMGMPVDYANAGQLYSLAANQGHAAATGALARLHAQGLGTAASPVKAWALASLAIERGDDSSKALLGELTTRLDEKELSEARKVLADLKKPADLKDSAGAGGSAPATDKPAKQKDSKDKN